MPSFEKRLRFLAVKVDRNRYIVAIRTAFIAAMPLFIAGSIFLLLANLPIQVYTTFIQAAFGESWQEIFTIPNQATMGMMTVYIIVGVAGSLAKHYKLLDDFSTIMSALAAFFLITPIHDFIDPELGSGFSIESLGSSTLFTGILVAILTVEILHFCEAKMLQ